ncbi:response regulator [Pseudonocardia sp. H11422]|uniref:response regulator n=1 Tax=Pseudonocardia sp. H11422 TaxID=2835866 RepID=UPI001BDCEC88|nr:response regulator transcription factor [Pseudonocardia sp. H11422]
MAIADDHPVYREGMVRAIGRHPELELVAELSEAMKALAEIRALEPDVAVLDLRLPDLDAITVIETLEQEGLQTKVVIVSAYCESATVYRALSYGARAYLSKVCSGDFLCDAVLAVARGSTVIPGEIQSELASEIRARRERGADNEPVLSIRELEVLRLAAEGVSSSGIAERLFVSTATVKTHLQHLYTKLEVSDRAAAVAAGFRRGLLK